MLESRCSKWGFFEVSRFQGYSRFFERGDAQSASTVGVFQPSPSDPAQAAQYEPRYIIFVLQHLVEAMRKNKKATSEGSFFALSKQIFAKKHLFCIIFQDLQDLRTFSPSLGVAAVHDFSDFLLRRFVVQVACCSFFRGVIVVRNDVSRRDFLRFLFALDIQLFGVCANTFTIAQELAYPGCLR